jgi:hypothetical protein
MLDALKCFQHFEDDRELEPVVNLISTTLRLNPTLEKKFYTHILTDGSHITRERCKLKDKKWRLVENDALGITSEALKDLYVISFRSTECVHYNKQGTTLGGYAVIKSFDWRIYEPVRPKKEVDSSRKASMHFLVRIFSVLKDASRATPLTIKGNLPAIGSGLRYECLVKQSYGKTLEYDIVQTICWESNFFGRPSKEGESYFGNALPISCKNPETLRIVLTSRVNSHKKCTDLEGLDGILREEEFNKLKLWCRTANHTSSKPDFEFNDKKMCSFENKGAAKRVAKSKVMLVEKHKTLWKTFPNAADHILSSVPINLLSLFEMSYAGEMFSAWFCGIPMFNYVIFVCLWAIKKWRTERVYDSPYHVIELASRFYPEKELRELKNWLFCASPSPDHLFDIFKERDWTILNFYRSCEYSLLGESRNTAETPDRKKMCDPIAFGYYGSSEFCKMFLEDLCDSGLWVKLKKQVSVGGDAKNRFTEYRYTNLLSYFNAKIILSTFSNKSSSQEPYFSNQIYKKLRVLTQKEEFLNLEKEQRAFVISSCAFSANLCVGLPGVGKTHSTFLSQEVFEVRHDPFAQRLFKETNDMEGGEEEDEDESLFTETATNYFALTTTGSMADALGDLGFKNSSTLDSFFLDVFINLEARGKKRFDELKKCVLRSKKIKIFSESLSNRKITPSAVTFLPRNVRLAGFSKEDLISLESNPDLIPSYRPKGRIFLDEFSNVGDEALATLCRALIKLKCVTGIEFGVTCSFDPLQTLPINSGMACLDFMKRGKSYDAKISSLFEFDTFCEDELRNVLVEHHEYSRPIVCVSKLTKPKRFMLESDIYVSDMLIVCNKCDLLASRFKNANLDIILSRRREFNPSAFQDLNDMKNFPGTFNEHGKCENWASDGFLDDGVDQNSQKLSFYLESIHPIPAVKMLRPARDGDGDEQTKTTLFYEWSDRCESFYLRYLQTQVLAFTNSDCAKINETMKELRSSFVKRNYKDYHNVFSREGLKYVKTDVPMLFSGDKIVFSKNFYFRKEDGSNSPIPSSCSSCVGFKSPRNGSIKTFSGFVGRTLDCDWHLLVKNGLSGARIAYRAILTDKKKGYSKLSKEQKKEPPVKDELKFINLTIKNLLKELKDREIDPISEEYVEMAEWLKNYRWYAPEEDLNYDSFFLKYVIYGKKEGLYESARDASTPFFCKSQLERAKCMITNKMKGIGDCYFFFDSFGYCLSFYDMMQKFLETDPNILHPNSYKYLEKKFENYFLPGWCVTTDKSQGRQYENAVLYVSSGTNRKKEEEEKEEESERPKIVTNKCYDGFDKSRGHVALTRPKKNFVILGPMNEFLEVCKRNERTGDDLSSALDCLLEEGVT